MRSCTSIPSRISRYDQHKKAVRRNGMILLKRVYDHDGPVEGAGFLVERLWPRGVRKEALAGIPWLKEVAPSAELRTWFSHDPAKWNEFRRRYFAELDAHPEAWQ